MMTAYIFDGGSPVWVPPSHASMVRPRVSSRLILYMVFSLPEFEARLYRIGETLSPDGQN